jgi:hypothetical protein
VPRGTSAIELALAKPLGVSKKFHLLDVATLSQGHAGGVMMTHTAQLPAFDNLDDDSSPDVPEAPSPGATMEKAASSPPLASGEFLRFSFTILIMVLIDGFFLQTLPGLRLCWIFRWGTWMKTWCIVFVAYALFLPLLFFSLSWFWLTLFPRCLHYP